MDDKKYLNEEAYQKAAKKLKGTGKVILIIGIVILLAGIICLITGFIKFSTGGLEAVDSFGTDVSGVTGGFTMFVIGMFVLGLGSLLTTIGGVMLFIGYQREIKAFTTQQAMPVVKETVKDVTPTVASAAGSIAKEVSKGIAEGKSEVNKEGE